MNTNHANPRVGPPLPAAEERHHILVVDDDARLRTLLQRYLSDHGYRVTTAQSAAEARQRLQSFAFDLIVLDVMMPGETGLRFVETLREASDVPVLMLTALSETEHRIAGLERGADDYLAKPFEPRELLLRIGLILRRSAPAPAAPPPAQVRLGAFRYDVVREDLWQGETRVPLTAAERRLLTALARQPAQPLGREALLEATGISGNLRTIDVQVTRLRRKIEPDSEQPRYLRTVRGEGYVLIPD